MTSRPNRISLSVMFLAVVFVLVGVWGIYTSDGAAKARERDARLDAARESGTLPVGPTPSVTVVTAERVSSAEIIELSGVLEPVRATWVAAERAGRIVEVPAQEHAPIASGGLLVRLDSELAEAELIRSQASHRLAKDELERQVRLGSRSVASEAELDRATAEERRSYAALLEARTRLSHTRISAPFDGLVNSLDLDPGAYVQPGTPIAEILDVSRVEVSVLVNDRQVGALAAGGPTQVRIDPLGGERIEGRIARVAGAPAGESQRYPVVIELDNEQGRLRPGMMARVQFEVGTVPAFRVPSRAVQHEFELDYVFVLDGEDKARRIRVTTRPVPFRPDRIEIESGLNDGDRVVTSGVSELRPGQRVRIQ